MWARRRLEDLVLAGSLLTRLPMPRLELTVDGSALGRALWAYPVIGTLVAAIGAGVLLLGHYAGLPPLLAAVLALAGMALATGAFHEDGLADFADGIGGGQTREEKLRIMTDSRLGTYGALAIVVSFAARAASLGSLEAGAAALALIGAGAFGRGMIAVPLLLLRPAKQDGLGTVAARPPAASAVAAIGLGTAVLVAAAPSAALAAAGAALVAVLGLAALARRHLGGYTGDGLGASEQVAEIAVLTVLAASL